MSDVTVNGVPVAVARFPSPEAAAVHELLRQRALALGLLTAGADEDAVSDAIERLLDREARAPEPTEEECRRYYAANAKRFVREETAVVRHILFQVVPGIPVEALREKAQATLAELLRLPERFEALARQYSNCPSAQRGGELGPIRRGETVPEFERAIFDGTWTGIRGHLVKTRFGFHIVAVDRRVPGQPLAFEAARDTIARSLNEQAQRRALAQYVRILAGQAEVRGVDLGAARTPLVR